MRRVHLLVEGQTEEAVYRAVLEPFLLDRAVSPSYSILATKRPAAGGKHRGGVSSWPKIEREIQRLLGDSSIDVVTTMIDYYGLPADSPGMSDRPDTHAPSRVGHVEAAMGRALGTPRFAPHLTVHELEAWVLSGPDAIARRFARPELVDLVGDVVDAAGGPEHVNDGPDTAPSKRLQALVPAYGKVIDGPAVIADTGLPAVLERCPHARAWLESLTG